MKILLPPDFPCLAHNLSKLWTPVLPSSTKLLEVWSSLDSEIRACCHLRHRQTCLVQHSPFDCRADIATGEFCLIRGHFFCASVEAILYEGNKISEENRGALFLCIFRLLGFIPQHMLIVDSSSRTNCRRTELSYVLMHSRPRSFSMFLCES